MYTVHCSYWQQPDETLPFYLQQHIQYVLYTLIASIFKGTWSQEGTGGAEPAHTNHPNFHLKERLLNLRRRECFVCLPYYYFMPLPKAKLPNFSARQYLRICKFLCLSLRGQNGGFSREKCGNTNLVTHKPRKSLNVKLQFF